MQTRKRRISWGQQKAEGLTGCEACAILVCARNKQIEGKRAVVGRKCPSGKRVRRFCPGCFEGGTGLPGLKNFVNGTHAWGKLFGGRPRTSRKS